MHTTAALIEVNNSLKPQPEAVVSASAGSISGGPDVELMRKFCQPGHPQFGDVWNSYNYRGNGVNYDLCATNLRVLLCVRKFYLEGVKEERCGIATQWWWAMSEIATGGEFVKPATAKTIARVSKDLLHQLKELPELQFLTVPRVKVWSHGRGKPKQKIERIDDDGVVFFRYRDGVGCVVAASKSNDPSPSAGGRSPQTNPNQSTPSA